MNKFMMTLMMVVGCMPLYSQELNIRDEQGRTPLMNYVIQQEAEITIIKKDIDVLWHECFQVVSVCVGQHSSSLTLRKLTCTDKDIIDWKQRKADLKDFIANTAMTLKSMAQAGCDVEASDFKGYTAINYCYTYEVYQALDSVGVPFQWKVWAYFNPVTAVATGTVTGLVAVGTAAVVGALSADMVSMYIQKNSNYELSK